jgi:hypothetical protein
MEEAEGKVVRIPHTDRLRAPFRVCIQNATTSLTVLCSKDILQIRSGYFKEIIDTKVDEDDVILPEDDPEEASLFLLDIHNLSFAAPHVIGSTKGQDLKWNKVWALLSVRLSVSMPTNPRSFLIFSLSFSFLLPLWLFLIR